MYVMRAALYSLILFSLAGHAMSRGLAEEGALPPFGATAEPETPADTPPAAQENAATNPWWCKDQPDSYGCPPGELPPPEVTAVAQEADLTQPRPNAGNLPQVVSASPASTLPLQPQPNPPSSTQPDPASTLPWLPQPASPSQIQPGPIVLPPTSGGANQPSPATLPPPAQGPSNPINIPPNGPASSHPPSKPGQAPGQPEEGQPEEGGEVTGPGRPFDQNPAGSSGMPGLLPLPNTAAQGSHTGALDSGTGLPSSGAASLLPGVTELDILNYLLALQCLHVNFYSCGAFGQPATSTLPPAGCKQADLPEWLLDYAASVAAEGVGQAKLLKQLIKLNKGEPLCPIHSLGPAFNELVLKAFNGSLPLNSTFGVFDNEINFLQGAFVLDHVTAAAYLGATALSNPQVNREIITLIAAAKEEHVGIIRARVNDQLTVSVPDSKLTFEKFNTAINQYMNKLAGGELVHPLFTDQGQQISNVDSNGVPPRALPAGVRQVLTLGAQAGQGGGFFPNSI